MIVVRFQSSRRECGSSVFQSRKSTSLSRYPSSRAHCAAQRAPDEPEVTRSTHSDRHSPYFDLGIALLLASRPRCPDDSALDKTRMPRYRPSPWGTKYLQGRSLLKENDTNLENRGKMLPRRSLVTLDQPFERDETGLRSGF